MPSAPQWLFDPFSLDPTNACLWCDDTPVALPPKAFDVLHYLVTHPDRLVTKDELLDAVWPARDHVANLIIGIVGCCYGNGRVQTVVSRESVSTMMNCQPTPCKGT